MADDGLERIREMLGVDALSDLSALDLSLDLHVDRVAAVLWERFRDGDDSSAFRLLVEFTTDRLAVMAQDVAADLGLGVDANELVTNFFSRLFIDVRPHRQLPLHFLASAADELEQDAETIIRDLALGEVADPEEPVVWQDGSPSKRHDDTKAMVAQATRIGFHRLDRSFRRVLGAKNEERMRSNLLVPRSWYCLILTTAMIFTVVATPGGMIPPGPALVFAGGGGANPTPPQAGHRPTPVAPGDINVLPLHVAIIGQATSYTVVVTSPSGAIVAMGETNAQGMIQLKVPAVGGLELDVLDTTVVGLPVAGGQAILITIP